MLQATIDHYRSLEAAMPTSRVLVTRSCSFNHAVPALAAFDTSGNCLPSALEPVRLLYLDFLGTLQCWSDVPTNHATVG